MLNQEETVTSIGDVFALGEESPSTEKGDSEVEMKPVGKKTKSVRFDDEKLQIHHEESVNDETGLSLEEENTLRHMMPNFDDVKNALGSARTPSDMSFETTHIKGRTFLRPDMDTKDKNTDESSSQKKFGTWDGVFVSCLLSIFGVIMFLRLPWVVGQAGVLLTVTIVLLAGVVTTLTTLSMSAIATNGEIKAGGAYYMISRALGPQIGGSVGILFALGNGVAVALYVIGFCETLSDGIGIGDITGDALNDIRLLGIGVLVVCLICVLIGVGWIIRMQLMLITLLIVAILSFVIGAFLEPNPEMGFVGFGGYSLNENGTMVHYNSVFADNLFPKFQSYQGIDYDYFSVFSVFFPAATGIMAGANISGDLVNPSENIPRGTMSAIVLSSVVYCILAIICGAIATRETLIENTLFMVDVSIFGPIILAGIYAATFSSALAALVGGPRILYSVALDELLPPLNYFAKTNAKGDPIRGYVIVFIVSICCVLVGELNLIAPLISMFFLMTYALVNYACFELSRSKSPGWRPSFTYYTWYTALAGFILCIIAMFLTNVIYAVMASFIGVMLYKYIDHVDPKVNWGSAVEARREMQLVKDLLNRKDVQMNIKNFRPNYLICVRHVEWERSSLMKFGSTLRSGYGLELYGHVLLGDPHNHRHTHEFLEKFKIPGKCGYIESVNLDVSNIDLLEQTNKLYDLEILSSDQDGITDADEDIMNKDDERIEESDFMALRIRSHSEMDTSKPVDSSDSHDAIKNKGAFLETVLAPTFREGAVSLMQAAGLGNVRPNTLMLGYLKNWKTVEKQQNQVENYVGVIRDAFNFRMHVMIVRGVSFINWSEPRSAGTLDVWWLVDDGGMTIMVAHLLNKSPFWSGSKVRLFVIGDISKREKDKKEIMELLSKFRLSWEVQMISLDDTVQEETQLVYDKIVATTPYDEQQPVTKHTTRKWLLTADALHRYSRRAKMVIITLPHPRSNTDPRDYMSWLEVLTKDFYVPTCFVRGNGDNVMTYRSE